MGRRPRSRPASQPTAPQAAVAKPKTTNGSNPITCAPRDSRSTVERTCTPRIVLKAEVMTEEAKEYLRREVRSLKKEFQSSAASVGGADFAEAVEFARREVLRRMGDERIVV